MPKSSWSFIGICKINTHMPTLDSSEVLDGYNFKEASKEEIAYNLTWGSRRMRGTGERGGTQN